MIALIIASFCGIVLWSLPIYVDSEYYIHNTFNDKIGHEIYVLKALNYDSNYKVVTFNELQDAPNNILIIEEVSVLFVGISILFGIYFVFATLYVLDESWEVNTSLREAYSKMVTRHKDIDFIYFVLRGKVIKKVANSEEGGYSDNVEHISYVIDFYIKNKNLLDDFKGTLMERRDKAFDEILK